MLPLETRKKNFRSSKDIENCNVNLVLFRPCVCVCCEITLVVSNLII